ncbi:protein-methionine-sulfoxide reductase heme-binding subunit MsrQ [Deinococcus multiflagellatus]|uniref:protein-methionine-sulfoxide reductase heme-binding subunit MsrQ n=1 Tax=Deinococcus multiflagellatus TaxID=1656887 RepID=UPI001CCDBAA2|nr:protein-methionine-sulfoxide reductase heme-binding subunit MsrQ [Deinococcus multiflagellatus]MBZ9713815.1 sulfoxide reductase heme-binding subunit YedZ [Deinococcus multiflagellatus]
MPAVVTGGLLPAAVLVLDALSGALGANPIQRATQQTGLLALVLLLLSLACTPLRRWTGWTWPARVRKSLGLLAFGYAALHFLIYLFDHGFAPVQMTEDVLERPFITVGFTALLLLVPLALTSTPRAVRRLGFARWTGLHRLVYVSVWLATLHYYWGVKKDHTPPLMAAAVLALLFLARWWRPRQRAARPLPTDRGSASP